VTVNNTLPEAPTRVWPIIRTTLGNGSPEVKRLVRRVAVVWMLMVALQVWDSRDGRGAAGIAEFLSALLAISGLALLGVAGTLQLAMKEAAAREPRPGNAEATRVLLALPAVGVAAAVGLGGAALLMIVRAVLGAELPFAVIAAVVYSSIAILASRMVHQSARTLFEFGASQARAAADLRTAATAARLDALQARMNPHVLFNALNTVASLVRSDPPAAERVVMTLSDVLRQTLERSFDANGTVDDEVAYVRACLALEQERLGGRLRVSWAIDKDVGAWNMPPFVIQPLVENSLRHGPGARLDGGHIRIAVEGHGDTLTVSVEDDGVGFPPRWREGQGLGNLRQRLQAMYGAEASLAIESPPAGGARVTVRMPGRPRQPAPDAAGR
jgi:signal transduction histidine kinase